MGLSCIISDAGSQRQPLHPDTPCSGNACAPLLTAFVALQDICEDMGPTIVCPRTHNQSSHSALDEIKLEHRDCEKTLSQFGARQVVCPVGSALLMDSRLLHCGGANASTGKARR